MANKSLANSILSDLRKEQFSIKKERYEKAKKNEEICISIMQNFFDDWLYKKGSRITEGSYYAFPDGLQLPTTIQKADFLRTIDSLGFFYMDGELKPEVYIGVPKFVRGKMSKAQVMHKEHTVAYNKAKKIAQQEINRVWESIKARDFSSEPNDDETFTIKLTLSSKEERCSYICDELLKNFLSQHSFNNATIEDDILSFILG